MEETALREANDLKTNTTYFSVIGVVSPMIGLTGTVWGMIGAFKTLGQNGITDPSALAGKIGEVLIATMSGLVVAVPAFVFFYILRARAQSAILHAESQVYRLLDDIPYDQLSGCASGRISARTSRRSRGRFVGSVTEGFAKCDDELSFVQRADHGGDIAVPELRDGTGLGNELSFTASSSHGFRQH